MFTPELLSARNSSATPRRYWKEDIIDPEVEVSAHGIHKDSDQPGNGLPRQGRFIAALRYPRRKFARGEFAFR
jgi:hypothetical protein